ncbi:long-chain-fatty-acid--CoA ligase [Microbacterium sp. RD1]|uniref:long-chain-fatty-acid--CoA ligase n=1 Tax=Microbacterium sp. RD1 TaxID=3457313 RepID=UPI003FA52F1A
MFGRMQERPLSISDAFRRAERLFPDKLIVTLAPAPLEDVAMPVSAWAVRVRRLAAALDDLDLAPDARVGTFGVNSQRHLEAYFAVPMTGRILHTVNIRLSAADLEYVITHAADEALLVDRGLLATLWPLADRLPTVRTWIVLADGSDAPIPADPRILDYDALLAASTPRDDDFRIDDETRASALCYTSGTTGKPKGVLYSHRSTMLHTLGALGVDSLAVSEADVVMPIVPMFHVNAWGLPYAAALAGATLVLPGRATRPPELLAAMQRYGVTLTAAATTVWNMAAPHLADYDLSRLRMVLSGGSSTPTALSETWRLTAGVPITHSWGMTEISPLAVLGRLRPEDASLDEDEARAKRSLQGRPVALVDVRLRADGVERAWDGESVGEAEVSGPWVAAGYYRRDDDASITPDGWLRTGDLATITPDGYLHVVDRLKDIIKSGGEWIPSVELENAIMAHPLVVEAAVIGRPDERWAERPVACVVAVAGAALTAEDILDHLRPLVAKWWLPDDIVFLPELPKTGSGKFAKAELRRRYAATGAPM